MAGELGFQAAGTLAEKNGWAEGSKEKVALHAAVGATVAALGGGDVAQGLTSAAAMQLALPRIVEVLGDNQINPRSPTGSAILQAASLAIGAAVGGGTGAGTALSATTNNYLSHRENDELKQSTAACKQGDKGACDKAESLEELDRQRDADYARAASEVRDQMQREDTSATEENFSRLMDARYWRLQELNKEDIVYPGVTITPTYPGFGQRLYGKIWELPASLPDGAPQKAPALTAALLIQGVVGELGDTFAAWMGLGSSDGAVNPFTGEVISGTEAWETRFGSVAGAALGASAQFVKGVQSARRATDLTNRKILFDTLQLNRKFKHADDFGIATTRKNPATITQFRDAVAEHMKEPDTIASGQYGFNTSHKVFYNPRTMRVVVTDKAGNFVTGFRLDPNSPQLRNYLESGVLR